MRVFCGGFRYQGEIDDRSRLLRKYFQRILCITTYARGGSQNFNWLTNCRSLIAATVRYCPVLATEPKGGPARAGELLLQRRSAVARSASPRWSGNLTPRTTPEPAPSCCAVASSRARTACCLSTRACAEDWPRAARLSTNSATTVPRGSVMSLIPRPDRLLALAALVVALIGFGWIKGADHVQAKWDAAVQQQTLRGADLRASVRRRPSSRSSPSTSTVFASSARRATTPSRMVPV